MSARAFECLVPGDLGNRSPLTKVSPKNHFFYSSRGMKHFCFCKVCPLFMMWSEYQVAPDHHLFQLICLKPKITSCTIPLNLYLEELLTKNFIFLIGVKYFYCHDKTWKLHIVKNDRNEDNFWKNYCIGEQKGKEEKKTYTHRKVPWVRDLKIKQRVTNI